MKRADDLLSSLLSKESLPRDPNCSQCLVRLGTWRCRDCVFGPLLCRGCFRLAHKADPLHRIERWTGSHFRMAFMWEVGGYILVRHQTANPMCQSLCFQVDTLERFQINKDKDKEIALRQHGHIGDVPPPTGARGRFSDEAETNAEAERNEDDEADDNFLDHLDSSYDGLKEGDYAVDSSCDAEADLDNLDFLPPLNDTSQQTPRTDGLNNHYVRIVHVNGIHHLALVSCACRGHENVPLDLMFSGLVPTSFVRFRTLFTVAVLDHFRLSNLELKASAYQYFHFLQRMTMPTAPTQVINFYHELRRLSRLWRWLKRMKWAGYGHSSLEPSHDNITEPSRPDPMDPSPGELAIFCPACPQPGINIPSNWKDDEERWKYCRFFVADGNFKADHVYYKKAVEDVWLGEGGGMIPNRKDYKEFLENAKELRTVGVRVLYDEATDGFVVVT